MKVARVTARKTSFVAVADGLRVSVGWTVSVAVADAVGVTVTVAVLVGVGVFVGADVFIGTSVGIGVGVTPQAARAKPIDDVPHNLKKSRRVNLFSPI